MQPVTCRTCGNRVLAEKYSETHTSIQWLTESDRSCPRFRAEAERGHATVAIPTCIDLRDTIDELAERGELLLSPRSYPTPGRLD
ncbi:MULTISPECIES: hypothetical protein [Rhodococcus]|uniref:hypothetical protein n=1 Tax=Rhodococcus TaxID=1827 RepID=UPI00045CED9A|nr:MULTISPECIES: hypothetical protein [Rhodococcus]KDE12252.1 hypothetical protein N505_0118310 [Rhodococcus aetherivorans]OLL18728.1 hypothetical protein BKE56_001125 [Rhodococcus sp. M8]QPG47414.1 hypothetical protein ISO16_10720 [Rhodococcus sp. M8]